MDDIERDSSGGKNVEISRLERLSEIVFLGAVGFVASVSISGSVASAVTGDMCLMRFTVSELLLR